MRAKTVWVGSCQVQRRISLAWKTKTMPILGAGQYRRACSIELVSFTAR